MEDPDRLPWSDRDPTNQRTPEGTSLLIRGYVGLGSSRPLLVEVSISCGLAGWLAGWMIGWLVGWLVCRSVGRSVGRIPLFGRIPPSPPSLENLDLKSRSWLVYLGVFGWFRSFCGRVLGLVWGSFGLSKRLTSRLLGGLRLDFG